jgi:glycosyltransferase involved in cell wall biosynthesis
VTDLISIITPTFNDSYARLTRTVASALKQTHKNIEVIVVDDGSTIPFGGIDRDIGDSRIRWIPLSINSGVARARNEAIKVAEGDYIAFLDSGDWWEKDKLESQLTLFCENDFEPALVYCEAIKHFSNGICQHVKASKRGDLFRDLLVGQPIVGGCASVMMRKRILKQAGGGFYDIEDIPEDRDLWLKIAKFGKIDFVPRPLVHLESRMPLSRSYDPRIKEITYARFLKIHDKELKENGVWHEAWSKYHRAISKKYFITRHFFNGAKHLKKSIGLQPTQSIFKVILLSLLLYISPNLSNYLKMIRHKSKSNHHK